MNKLILLSILAAGQIFAGDYKLGWKSNPEHKKGLTQLVHHPAYKAAPLPKEASLEALMPPVYDQGNIGSCTANAGCGAFDYKWKVQHGQFAFPSRLDLYQNELKHDGNFPKDEGSYTSTIAWVLTFTGVCREKTWPYIPSNLAATAPSCAAKERPTYRAMKYYDVDTKDGVSIKQAVANAKLPVPFGAVVFKQIFDVSKQNPLIAMPKGVPAGGHEMVIVGYDDARQCYRVRNSWGTSWGDGGYAWIPYAYIHNPKWVEDAIAIELTK